MTSQPDKLRRAFAAHREGNLAQAERAYRELLNEQPGLLEVRRSLAWALHQQGRSPEAVDQMRRLVREQGDVAATQLELGTMERQAGLTEEAINSFQNALRQDPNLWHAHFNLANAFQQQSQFELAVVHYLAALRFAPDDPDIHLNLGAAQRELGDLDQAQSCFERVIQLQENSADAWTNLGLLYKARNQLEEAINCHRRAIVAQPKSAQAHNNLGTALRAKNDLTAAIAAFTEALRLNSKYLAACTNLASAYEANGDCALAAQCQRQAKTLSGDDGFAIKAALVMPVIMESDAAIAERRQRLQADLAELETQTLWVADPVQSIGTPLFALAYHGENEVTTQRRIAELLRRACPSLAYVALHCRANAPFEKDRRLRVGFISTNFRNHTIGKLNAGLIQQLDRERFSVTALRFSPPSDAVGELIHRSADQAIVLKPQLESAREQIAALKLDLLFYTDIGMDAITYYLAHARLAPVQCTTWGHPLTTGISTMDYFVSSQDLEPADGESHYTERLARLPHLANYYFRPEPTDSTKTRADLGLSESDHVYGCLQSLFKLHPDDDRMFGEILRRDPKGVLVLLSGQIPRWAELLSQRMERTLEDLIDRVRFLPYQPAGDFPRLIGLCDVLVDPSHFGGGDTSYQTFAVGTPLVTLPGPFLRSRITYALYRTLGMDDCIATSPDDLVERAVRLASDPDHRRQVRARILDSNRGIFENIAAVRSFESFLLEAAAAPRPAAS